MEHWPMRKTNAYRILEKERVPFECHEFAATAFTCEEVAEKLSLPLTQVFKTLVARGDRTGPLLALLPGDRELDLKKLAAISGNKSCKLVKKAEVEQLTGYLPGGCSPRGQKRGYPVYADDSVSGHSVVSISAGLRGVQLFVPPNELLRLTKATVARLVSERAGAGV